jgi:hypothetical protein
MYISCYEEVYQNPELKTRWQASIKRSRAFSKIALIEFERRNIRLDVLLRIMELEWARRVINELGAKQTVRTRRNGLIVLGGLGFLTFVLDFLLIWPFNDPNYAIFFWVWLSLIAVGHLEGAQLAREYVSADRAIDAAILEFERVSGARFPSYDLELLNVDGARLMYSNFVNEEDWTYEIDDPDGLRKRRAELVVDVMEHLVERIEMLDNEKLINL